MTNHTPETAETIQTAVSFTGTDKQALRREIRRKNRALPEDYCKEADQAILAAVLSLPDYRAAETLFCFVGTKEEINTVPIIEAALAAGKRVTVPRCTGDGLMEAYQITALSELREGHYGILEPREDAPLIKPEEISLALVPCVSAARDGRRLGHGGGYYDRYLPKTNALRAILCRGRLLSEDIPSEAHDQRMDCLITEEGILRFDT